MEVHPEPNDRSSKQKNKGNFSTPNENGSKGECNDLLRSLDNPSNQKTIKIPVVMVDNNGDAVVKMSETDPMSHLSNPIIMDSPAANEDNAREVIADVNSSSTDDPSQEKIPEIATAESADHATRITSDTKEQSVNQENVEFD